MFFTSKHLHIPSFTKDSFFPTWTRQEWTRQLSMSPTASVKKSQKWIARTIGSEYMWRKHYQVLKIKDLSWQHLKLLISEWCGVTHKFSPQISQEGERPGVRRPTTLSLLKACAVAFIWIAYSFQPYSVQMSLLRPKGSPTKLWHESDSLKQLPHHFGLDTKGLWIQK